MERNLRECLDFWEFALCLSKEQLSDGGFHTSSEGFYIDRSPEMIFLYHNLKTQTKALIATKENQQLLLTHFSDKDLSFEKIKTLPQFKDYKLLFDEIDFYIEGAPVFPLLRKANVSLREITRDDEKELRRFYAQISQEDRATLDLDFDDPSTKAIAVFENEEISTIGRYFVISTENGTMDITLATRDQSRKKGHATLCAIEILKDGLAKNLIPRYRMKTDNFSSRKVAEKLGFSPFVHIQAIGPED